MNQVQERNIALAIVFSIITCGIYALYWMIKINDDTIIASGEEGTSGGVVVLLTIVTCGIYGWYWIYKVGQRVDIIQNQMGKPASSNAVLYIILQIFGLGIINYALIQSELNAWVNSN